MYLRYDYVRHLQTLVSAQEIACFFKLRSVNLRPKRWGQRPSALTLSNSGSAAHGCPPDIENVCLTADTNFK